MAGEIVVGVGGGGSGFEAARMGARWAQLSNVALVLVFGYEASPMGPRGGPLEERISAVGDEAIEQIRTELLVTYPGLAIDVELVAQRPADALMSVAQARSAELIAVGHGGQGPLRAALLGSITYEVVHRATLPVLVVPNDEAD